MWVIFGQNFKREEFATNHYWCGRSRVLVLSNGSDYMGAALIVF